MGDRRQAGRTGTGAFVAPGCGCVVVRGGAEFGSLPPHDPLGPTGAGGICAADQQGGGTPRAAERPVDMPAASPDVTDGLGAARRPATPGAARGAVGPSRCHAAGRHPGPRAGSPEAARSLGATAGGAGVRVVLVGPGRLVGAPRGRARRGAMLRRPGALGAAGGRRGVRRGTCHDSGLSVGAPPAVSRGGKRRGAPQSSHGAIRNDLVLSSNRLGQMDSPLGAVASSALFPCRSCRPRSGAALPLPRPRSRRSRSRPEISLPGP